MFWCLGFILKSIVCHVSSLSGCSGESGDTSDLIRFVLFKDHSVPKWRVDWKGVGTD